MSRFRADTTPTVTEPPRPNGLPIAITQSPTRILSESPNFTALSGLSGFTRKTAMSVLVSRPMISALSLEPSGKLAKISSASAITWLLVMTMPDASMTKPEPSDDTRRGVLPSPRRLKNSSKNSSNGEPGGTCGTCACLPESTVCEVEMLTTASTTFSTVSATESGPLAEAATPMPAVPSASPSERVIAAAGRPRRWMADISIPRAN